MYYLLHIRNRGIINQALICQWIHLTFQLRPTEPAPCVYIGEYCPKDME